MYFYENHNFYLRFSQNQKIFAILRQIVNLFANNRVKKEISSMQTEMQFDFARL